MLKRNSNNSKVDIVNQIYSYKDLLSPNQIVGAPILVNKDLTIIPVLKSTIGYLGGIGEYGEVKLFSKEEDYPYAGGNGTIINMSPCGFLICKNNQDVSFIKVDSNVSDKFLDKTSSIIEKVMNNKWKK